MSEVQDGAADDALRFEKHDGIATLTMNRPGGPQCAHCRHVPRHRTYPHRH